MLALPATRYVFLDSPGYPPGTAAADSPIELYSTVGCHPTRCNEFLEDAGAYLDALEKLITSHPSKVVAIGECGLDYDRLHFCPEDIQRRFFAVQFDLAEKTKLPMFLHNRNTGNDFYDMIRQNRHRFTEGVVHSFDGTMEEMQRLVDLGLYIGINGCSLKTEENLEVAKAIPEDRLMFETGPWLDYSMYYILHSMKWSADRPVRRSLVRDPAHARLAQTSGEYPQRREGQLCSACQEERTV